MALFAGGEAGPFARWRIENHLTYCNSCREVVADFFHLQSDIEQLSEIPQLDWGAMSRDIKVSMQQALMSSDEVATSANHGWGDWVGRRPVWGLSVASAVMFGGFIVFQQLYKGAVSDTFVLSEVSKRKFSAPVETPEEKTAMVANHPQNTTEKVAVAAKQGFESSNLIPQEQALATTRLTPSVNPRKGRNHSAVLEGEGRNRFLQERETGASLFPAGLHYEGAEVGVAADGSVSIRTFDFSTDTVIITHVYIP
jgi:hypothetical protein